MDANMERRLTELILIARLNKQFAYKANGAKPSLVFSSEKEGWKTLLDDKETLEVSAGTVSRLRTEPLEKGVSPSGIGSESPVLLLCRRNVRNPMIYITGDTHGDQDR